MTKLTQDPENEKKYVDTNKIYAGSETKVLF